MTATSTTYIADTRHMSNIDVAIYGRDLAERIAACRATSNFAHRTNPATSTIDTSVVCFPCGDLECKRSVIVTLPVTRILECDGDYLNKMAAYAFELLAGDDGPTFDTSEFGAIKQVPYPDERAV